MNRKESLKQLTKQAVIGGLYCDSVEDLKSNKLWKHKVKSYTNKLKEEIKIYDDFFMKEIDIDSSQDFINGYQAISNLIDFNLSLSENQLKYFEKDIEKVINKYKNK